MPKKTLIKTILATLTVFIFVILLLLIIPVYIQPKNAVIDEYNNGTRLSASRIQKIEGGWDSVIKDSPFDIILTKFDIFYPTYSMVMKRNRDDYVIVSVISLKRTGIFSFSVVDSSTVFFSKKSFSEVVDLVKNQDVSLLTENKDIIINKSPFLGNPEKLDNYIKAKTNPEFRKMFEKCLSENNLYQNDATTTIISPADKICEEKVLNDLQGK